MTATDFGLTQKVVARLQRSNQTGGRLIFGSSTTVIFSRWNGEVIEVGEENVPIPSGSPLTLSNATNIIDSNGNDTGAGPVANTPYGVFLSNSRAAIVAGVPQLRLAAEFGSRGGNGDFYLAGSVGDGANWRCVGIVQTIAAAAFVDTPAQRLVLSRENQIPRTLLCTPGYNDNNAQTTVIITATNYAPINAGAGDFVEFISDGLTWPCVFMHVPILSGAAGVSLWGIGVNSTTTARASGVCVGSPANVNVATAVQILPTDAAAGTKVRCSMLAANTGAGATFIADHARNGSTADPIGAHLIGVVMQ